jgi:hypothetical protein
MSVTREELQDVLLKWQKGIVKPIDVLKWAEERYELEQLQDEVVIEILTLLDSLHFSRITVEDVPIFLQALSLPKEREKKSLEMLQRYFDTIDFETRESPIS